MCAGECRPQTPKQVPLGPAPAAEPCNFCAGLSSHVWHEAVEQAEQLVGNPYEPKADPNYPPLDSLGDPNDPAQDLLKTNWREDCHETK
eukprot:1056687-Amphidinium_carterae.1